MHYTLGEVPEASSNLLPPKPKPGDESMETTYFKMIATGILIKYILPGVAIIWAAKEIFKKR